MNTQQNQNDIKKKGVQVNPSRDINYDDKEKAFSGEFGGEGGEEINPSEFDNTEVDLDRGGSEFSGGEEAQPQEPGQPVQPDNGAYDLAVKNAGSKGSAQGYEGNSPDVGMSSDLGGDMSRTSGQAKGSNMGNRQGTQKTSDQKIKKQQDDSMRQ